MRSRGTAWCTQISRAELRLWWPYDEALLDSFRDTIPGMARRWFRDGSEMYWTVTGERWCLLAQQWFDQRFPTGGYQQGFWGDDPFREESERSQQKSSPPPPPPKPPPAPPSTSSDWDVLYLRRGAPAGLVDAAYRWWAKEAHPDRGGSTAKMQEINAAYTRLKQVSR